MGKEKEMDTYNVLCEAMKKYLREKGWELVVVGSPVIRLDPRSLKYNYEFAVGITAKLIEEQKQ